MHIITSENIREIPLDVKWSSLVNSTTFNPKDIKFTTRVTNGNDIAWDTNGKYLYILDKERPMVVQYQMR